MFSDFSCFTVVGLSLMSDLTLHASTALLRMREHFHRFVDDTSTFPTFLSQVKNLACLDGELEKLLPHLQRLQPPQGDAVEPPQEAQERRAAFAALDSFFKGLVEHPARVADGGMADGATHAVENASGSHASGVGVSSSAGGHAVATVSSQPTIDTSLVGALRSPFGDLLVSNEKLENALLIEDELSNQIRNPLFFFFFAKAPYSNVYTPVRPAPPCPIMPKSSLATLTPSQRRKHEIISSSAIGASLCQVLLHPKHRAS